MSNLVLGLQCSPTHDSVTALQRCEATVITVVFSNPENVALLFHYHGATRQCSV